ncbi:MAG TPA: hypothetical protein DCY07_07950 [Rhodospirillaceae bacterium]|nr:hypothetical protein [Rhodospirillaceae bacterium]
MTLISILLDLILIGLLGAGITYAIKLTQQLADMRAHRADMERFVFSFNATVNRAEAGIRGLKEAARSSGDDIEKLIEKGSLLRDELLYLTESADQIATRLSDTAGRATRAGAAAAEAQNVKAAPSGPEKKQEKAVPSSSAPPSAASVLAEMKTASTAERELMRALGKLG